MRDGRAQRRGSDRKGGGREKLEGTQEEWGKEEERSAGIPFDIREEAVGSLDTVIILLLLIQLLRLLQRCHRRSLNPIV